MKVLSLFDGMACGMIAMQLAGIEVESCDAYEIDKYAIKTAQHNFPMIKEHGDVFEADFAQYEGVDFLIGGSPCTYWSIAQTKNRETVASGMGWELFSQYVRALHEAKPKYFIYENNKSMSKQIRASIDKAFGFEAVLINSALVSAQNRQRLYWVGKQNPDGTYSKVDVEQPDDRGILLKDVLDGAVAMREEAHAVIASAGRTTEREFFTKNQGNMVAEPINVTADGKSRTLKAQYCKNSVANFCCYSSTYGASGVAEPINDILQVGAMPRPDGEISTSAGFRIYSTEAKGRYLCANGGGAGAKTGLYAVPVGTAVDAEKNTVAKAIDDIVSKKDYLPEMFNPYNRAEITTKSPTLSTGSMVTSSCAVLVVETAYGKKMPIYEVCGGRITINGKQYPIKLADGYYIIRKLTVRECMRLQTVPEWYEFPVSDSQSYKMLGNGWTCEVIAHILKYLKEA